MALIISNIAIIFQILTLKEAFEIAAELNEEVKWTECDEAFCKNFELLLDRFFHFFAKRRKSVEKMTHREKNRGHRTSKIVKSSQSCSNGHLPYYCSLYYFARTLDAGHGLWISCAVRMRTNNKRERPLSQVQVFRERLILFLAYIPLCSFQAFCMQVLLSFF